MKIVLILHPETCWRGLTEGELKKTLAEITSASDVCREKEHRAVRPVIVFSCFLQVVEFGKDTPTVLLNPGAIGKGSL